MLESYPYCLRGWSIPITFLTYSMKCLFYKFLMDCTLFVTSRSIDNKGHFTFIMVERPILFSSNTFYPIQVTPRFFREFLRKADTKDKLLTLGLFHTHLVPHKVSVTPR